MYYREWFFTSAADGIEKGQKTLLNSQVYGEDNSGLWVAEEEKKIEVLVTAAGFNNNNIMWRHHLAKQGKQQQGLNKEYE